MPDIVTQIIAEQGGITERQLITDALHATHWSAHKAAARIGICYKTMYTRMQVLDIPTVAYLSSFWWGGHFDTICGHAVRLGLPKARTCQRYRRKMQLSIVFWPDDIPSWGYVNGTHSFGPAAS